jgi:hypothetical protein
MARQNALTAGKETSLPTGENGMVQPVDVAHLIPTAKQARESRTTRTRSWEARNPSSSYRIPSDLLLRAKDLRAFILAKAEKHMTNTSVIANAMLVYSLACIRKGTLTLAPRPKPERRKLVLNLVETNGWPQEPTRSTGKRSKKERKPEPGLVLTYRWNADVKRQVKALAGEAISEGEVVVFLLHHALTSIESGQLKFQEQAITATQKVSPTW